VLLKQSAGRRGPPGPPVVLVVRGGPVTDPPVPEGDPFQEVIDNIDKYHMLPDPNTHAGG